MMYNKRIKEERRERKLSQETVARVLNIKQRTYSDYESGRIRLPIESMIKLASFYGVSIDYMCGATDDRHPYPDKK